MMLIAGHCCYFCADHESSILIVSSMIKYHTVINRSFEAVEGSVPQLHYEPDESLNFTILIHGEDTFHLQQIPLKRGLHQASEEADMDLAFTAVGALIHDHEVGQRQQKEPQLLNQQQISVTHSGPSLLVVGTQLIVHSSHCDEDVMLMRYPWLKVPVGHGSHRRQHS